MNLKTLTLSVIVLTLVSAGVAFLNRPTAPTDVDPRVGQPLLADAFAADANRLTLTNAGNTVDLMRNDDGIWNVVSYHNLPADVTKLSRFVRELTEATVDRVVTRDPERASRLELGTAEIELHHADSTTWSVKLGKTADRGGRYVRFEDADASPAYLARLSASLDSTSKNWANSKMVALAPENAASLALSLPDAGTFTVTRTDANGPWTSADLPIGQQIKLSRVNSILSSLSNLRFTETTAPSHQDALDASNSAEKRTLTLTNFAGQAVTIELARRAQQIVPKAPSETDEASETEETKETTETIPAGPVYASVSGDPALAPLTATPHELSFKVSDYSFTGLPTTLSDLYEPAPSSESTVTSPLAPPTP